MELTRKQILENLNSPDPGELFEQSAAVRDEACGKTVYIRGILEFSNCCGNDCYYCGLRRSNEQLQRYRMQTNEIVDTACGIVDSGIQTVVLQSGDDYYYTSEMISEIIAGIKKAHPDCAVTLSVGERPDDDYRAFREAGADRYLLKHETINERIYATLHPGQSQARRLEILRNLRALEYQIGTGFIIGLPGQTTEHLADEVMHMAELQPDMAGISPFVPHSQTPLAATPAGSVDLALRMLALSRLVTGNAHLPATTALATVAPESGYDAGLKAGANVIMIDCTADGYREHYQIYDNKFRTTLEGVQAVAEKNGLEVSLARGDSLKRSAAHVIAN